MILLSRLAIPTALSIPFVPLGIELDAGIALLSKIGRNLRETNEKEHSFQVNVGEASVAIYTHGTLVDAVWYDDPLGRWSARGKAKKIMLHLTRYGSFRGWSIWKENGWMKYWKHELAPVRMVYGIHMDVIRFNLISDAQQVAPADGYAARRAMR